MYPGLHLIIFSKKGKWTKFALTTGPFNTDSDNSKERGKHIEVLWGIDLEFLVL